jgi:molybdopterin molybdotransferase
MITVEQAKQLILLNIPNLSSEIRNIENATSSYVYKEIVAPIDVPSYDQSSMDGYALRYEDLTHFDSLLISGIMKAGSTEQIHCNKGETIRIFTGAPLPIGADTIIIQEKVNVHDNRITIDPHDIKLAMNVRAKGSEIMQGEVGLAQGTKLSPAAIGFLASIGVQNVEVYKKPKVGLLVTGDELIDVGNPISYGEVYESNSHTVKSFLNSVDIFDVTKYRAKDNLDELVETLNKALNENDIVLLTGGISVGEYDFVSQATKICGINEIFHKVKQKPGKPLFMGKKDNTVVFGLPGNPTSVLTCLYQYVYPALHAMYGIVKHLPTLYCELTNAYKKPSGITHFLKGYYTNNTVTILDGQESYKLKSYAITNCLVELGEEITLAEKGSGVNIYLL